MKDIDWNEHACLFDFRSKPKHCITLGALHAVVDVALLMSDVTDGLAIETDSGQMFCRREIRYIAALASRPSHG